MERPIVLLWENFGPLHVDRCDALAAAMAPRPVVGVEVLPESSEYDWISERGRLFAKITLNSKTESAPWSPLQIVKTIVALKPEAVFFCHYQRFEIFVAASIIRTLGILTFTMNDSKFDDYARDLWREVGKTLYLMPYRGALVASRRSKDYLRFLGIHADRIALGYDSVSVDRIRGLAKAPPAPEGAPFADRHFTIVARLLPKKNIGLALKALQILSQSGPTRRLVICGSGPLDAELKSLTRALGLENLVEFRGFVQTEAVCETLATSLCLILPSTEEQFGQVIPEALAMGVPVLASENCGARDELLETGVNGFMFEPTNAEGLAYFMRLLSSDEAAWRSMANAARNTAARGDVSAFVSGVQQLLDDKHVTPRARLNQQ